MQCLTKQTNNTGLNHRASPIWAAGLVVTLLLAPVFGQAKIYKTVDEDGNVSYSDTAPADAETRSESTIELEINNTYSAADSGPAGANGAGNAGNPGDIVSADGTAPPAGNTATYENIAISAPAADASLRSNSGDVTMSVSLQPSLRAGDQVRFFLDGKPVGTVTGTSLSLSNVDRGTHTLAAVVLDGAGKPRISSNTTSFTLQRFAPTRVSTN